jgi:hypothetical protein
MAFAADFCRSLTTIRRNFVSSISTVFRGMLRAKGMHGLISYLLRVAARQLIHGPGLGRAGGEGNAKKNKIHAFRRR